MRANKYDGLTAMPIGLIKRFLKDEKGVTAIEYGPITAIVAVGIIVGLGNLKTGLNTLFNNVKTNLTK
jgi:pilus assembly protein Flp/PilA